MAERNEVPFLGSRLFPVFFIGYVISKRVLFLLETVLGLSRDITLPHTGHLFVMTSSGGYRTFSFVEIAKSLKERGQDVLLLCSPTAASNRERFREAGLDTLEFTELVGSVRIHRLPVVLVKTATMMRRVLTITTYDTEAVSRVFLFNVMFLEGVKKESIRTVTEEDPVIHTFSPTPYLIESTKMSRVFAYQHGIQWDPIGVVDFAAGVPPHIPVTWLIWSDKWRKRFETYTHPDSSIIAVGSPWYDNLAEQTSELEEPTWDVLFVSASHAIKTPREGDQYEALVRLVVETCEKRSLSLAVKLHPSEDSGWYRDRGWDKYLVEFDDIDDALLDSGVAVTNTSSAFVESSILGTKMIVADVFGRRVKDLGPIENVVFAESVHEIPDLIADGTSGKAEVFSRGGLPMQTGNSTDTIVKTVLDRI